MIARLQREASAEELGAKSLKSVLVQRLRISGKEAARRLAEAKELGPRTALNGEPLEPLLAPTATAQRSGSMGPEHVKEIRWFLVQPGRPRTENLRHAVAGADRRRHPHPRATQSRRLDRPGPHRIEFG
ncbi:DUF222 domain-containing protein [Mycobacterium sp. NPDC006124]|uniref:DUF222 domain-containing protein n=1 Tax=Mycobacterium sp. NPDC006124 TaxID=3156729 RepID=UPI0033B7CD39